MKKVVFILISFTTLMRPVDIGSDTAVTRFNNQQVLNNGDRIAGFASIAAGFLIAN